ncbi:MAG TPA: mechanosensitive ion channel domain-containing protein [Stellaceae bacterium]|nr:mechanosensitive ion channel domain-containing protein [Stellaceae bacterium]
MLKCRTRLWPVWLVLFWMVAAISGGHAATPTSSGHAATSPAKPAAQPAPVSPDELQRLVDTLQNEKERARLVGELRALIAAQRKIPDDKISEKPAGILLLGRLSRQVDALTGEILAGVALLVDAPRLVHWAHWQITDAAARQRWIDAAYAFLLVFGFAGASEWAVRWVLAKVQPRFPVRHRDTRAVRALFGVLALVLDVAPLLVFATLAYGAVTMALDPFTPASVTLTVLVYATVEARLVLCVARALLLPADPGTLILPIDAETRNYLYIWVKRFAFCAIFGYAVPQAAWWLGIPGALYTLLLKLAGLVVALLALIFLLQNRKPIAEWIGGDGTSASSWGRVRRSLGDIWPLLAVFYIIGIYSVYALRIEGGFVYVLRATALSVVVIVASRILVRSMHSLSRHGFAISPPLKAQFPTLEHRANRYIPILTGLGSAAIYILAGLTLLQAWDISAFAWLDTDAARWFGGELLTIGFVIVASLAIWEIFSSAIERYLSRVEASQSPRRTRIRTLLPLLRTAMLSLIIVLSGLIVLSHLGVDIAPLLAGAGIVGVAIGFGSQALVKDVITGLFILAEDQLAVGDIVDVGKDHAGVVEAITIRTIRLRDQAGTVHTIPFSEVTSLKNMTRDFAYVVARITISYGEDIDRVVEILRGVSAELIEDETLKGVILEPFEYLGVDTLNEFSVVLLVRIRTLPAKQFVVGRAFNRLVTIAFAKHGVVSRDPAPMLMMTPPAAPAADNPAAAEGEGLRTSAGGRDQEGSNGPARLMRHREQG